MDGIIGQNIGSYLIEELIAKGEAGTVYKAHDMTINCTVVVKLDGILQRGVASTTQVLKFSCKPLKPQSKRLLVQGFMNTFESS